MLHRFQNICSRCIYENGGSIARAAGDSVLARFSEAARAAQAAVSLLEKIGKMNAGQTPDEHTRIRAVIHFGDVYIEKNELFGKVVRLANLIVQHIQDDQIVITQDMFDLIKNTASIPLKPADRNAAFPEETVLYEILRKDEQKQAVIQNSPTLHIRILWSLAPVDFSGIWEELISQHSGFSDNDIPEQKQITKKYAGFVIPDIRLAVKSALHILLYLKKNMEPGESFLIPVQIFIDAGTYFSDSSVKSNVPLNWNELEPGEIYLSMSAYEIFSRCPDMRAETIPSGKFCRLLSDENRAKTAAVFFRFRSALINGPCIICYYCGSRKHTAMNCPSKYLGKPSAMEKLGYLPVQVLNRLFFTYLTEDQEVPDDMQYPADIRHETADKGFYELHTVYQLRFFSLISATDRKEVGTWNDLKKSVFGWNRAKGGQTGLAYDCIKNARHMQAADILDTALQKTPGACPLLCLKGFLCMEQNDISHAEYYFRQALDYAKSDIQRVFVLLQLSRLFGVRGEWIRAENYIEEILSFAPGCTEALYQKIYFDIRRNQEPKKMENMKNLIQEDRKYFIHALIDPQMNICREYIHACLTEIFAAAKAQARAMMPKAEKELHRLQMLLGGKQKITDEILNTYEKIMQLYAGGSYFAYLDVIEYSESIISKTRRIIKKKKKEMYKLFFRQDEHCIELMDSIKKISSEKNNPLYAELVAVRNNIRMLRQEIRLESPAAFRDTGGKIEKLSDTINKIRKKFLFLKNMLHIKKFLFTFSKCSIVLQFLNIITGFLAVPFFLNVAMPHIIGFEMNLVQVRFCQIGFILIFGVLGFIISIYKGLKNIDLQ
ncbi:MAG: hypothetical protein V2I97_14175 [Desulfococcaceae bacterium]|nr:hypothetical protein [Desulfococcaceae bacterium]